MTHPKKVWHLGHDGEWRRMTMEAIDANHAVNVDPEHWSFSRPAQAIEPQPEPEPQSPVLTEDDVVREHDQKEQS